MSRSSQAAYLGCTVTLENTVAVGSGVPLGQLGDEDPRTFRTEERVVVIPERNITKADRTLLRKRVGDQVVLPSTDHLSTITKIERT